MTDTLKNIIDQSRTLSAEERAFIAHFMISSLEGKPEAGVEKDWLKLADQRYRELKSNKDQGLTWQEIKNQVKQ